MEGLIGIGAIVLVAVISVFVVAIVFSRLYQRATKEQAIVRTGMGGQKIIKDGGALVIPVLQEIVPINLTTLKLPLRRNGKDGLITKDKMRVDVGVEFFVRVKPEEAAIANAAQTLGKKTQDQRALTELIEGKLVDALRSVAAKMTLGELHEQRQQFVQNVQEVVSKDIEKNGLELESVSLTNLDQTSKEALDPNNVFDAEGLRLITYTVETKRKERNDITRENEVAIERRDLEAIQQTQELRREREFVQLETDREIAERTANTRAATAAIEAARNQEAEQARINAERAVEAERIAAAELLAVREAGKQKTVQIANQDREIAVAERSRDESRARAEADEARALAIRAQEAVATAQQVEMAERKKKISLIEAEESAQREAIGITVAATAEKNAAMDRAEAVRIEATARSEAEKISAEGTLARYTAEAEGQQKVNEAMNTLSEAQIALRVKEALIKVLPQVIAESVKPMTQIDSIRIVDVSGMQPGAGGAAGGEGGGTGSMADGVVNAALRHRAQQPLIDGILSTVGLDGRSLDGLAKPIHDMFGGDKPAAAKPAAPAPAADQDA